MGTRCTIAGGIYRFFEGSTATAPATTDTTITETAVRNFIKNSASTPFTTANGGTAAAWRRLPHTKSVSITADITEPEKIRTSDTGGLKIAGCGGSVAFNCEVTSYLDESDWLYNYILHDPTNPGNTVNPERWFAIINNVTPLAGNAIEPDGATFFKGRITPGGFSFDNESDTPQSVDWQITVTALVMPAPIATFTQGQYGLLNVT